MKRTKSSSLLTATAAVAGLAMGAGIALAAHPPIQLYTYEEVARQMTGPAVTMTAGGPNYAAPANMALPVMVDPNNKQGFPYSPKATCGLGGCHDGAALDSKGKVLASYAKLADHAFHAALGFNEWMDNDPSGLFIGDGSVGSLVAAGTQTGLNPQKPWLQSHGHNGKW
jgi:hypothetical protein